MARIRYQEAVCLEVKRGKPAIGDKPEKKLLKKLYIKESKSIREIVEILRCSKDMVYRSLKEYGIARRGHGKEPKLTKYSLDYLKKELAQKGYRRFAEELDVDKTTILRHLRRINKS